MNFSFFLKRYVKILTLLLFVFMSFLYFILPLLKNNFIGASGDLKLIVGLLHYIKYFLINSELPPFWNPYFISGTYCLGSLGNGLMYPFTLFLLYFFDVKTTLNLYFILHLFLSMSFMFIFIKELRLTIKAAFLAAVIYAFSGVVVGRIIAGHYTLISTYAYVPLILYLVNKYFLCKRKNFVISLLAITLSLQFLAGFPQIFIYSFFVYAPYFIFSSINERKYNVKKISYDILSMMFVCILFIGICAVQVLPQGQITEYSDRALGIPFSYFVSNSTFPLQLFNLFIPEIFSSFNIGVIPYANAATPHESMIYCGYFSILFIFLAIKYVKKDKQILFWVIMMLGMIIMSLGQYGLVFMTFYFLPVLGMLRDSSRFTNFIPLCIAVLAAFGFDYFIRLCKDELILIIKKVIKSAVIIFILGAVFHLGLYVLSLIGNKFFNSNIVESYMLSFLGEVRFIVFIIILIILLKVKLRFWNNQKIINFFNWSLILFAFIDLFSYFNLITVFEKSYHENINLNEWASNSIVNKIKSKEKCDTLFRVCSFDQATNLPGFGMTSSCSELSDVSGPAVPPIYRYRMYTAYINGTLKQPYKYGSLSGINIRKTNPKLLGLLNVKYFVYGAGNIVENKDCYPRFLFSPNYEIIKDESDILDKLNSASYSPCNYIVLEELPDMNFRLKNRPNKDEKSKIDIISIEPDRIKLNVDFVQNGFLLINNIYFPEWKAIVDNISSKIYRANYTFMSIAVPKGQHIIEIYYNGEKIKIGFVITLCTVMCLIILICVDFFKK